MDGFCGERFWDLNLTWYTDSPDFTPCFEKTALVWIPTLFLWMFIPFHLLINWNSQEKLIHWNPLNISKYAVNLLLLLLQCILLVRNIALVAGAGTHERILYAVDFLAPLTLGINLGANLFLIQFDRKKGIRSSGFLFNFWLLLAICEYFRFNTQLRLRLYSNEEEGTDIFECVTEVIFYPFIVAQLILYCWADVPPALDHPKEDPHLEQCPQAGASYLSKLLFSWLDGLILKGYRAPLEYSDVWDLNDSDKSKYLVPIFDKYWKETRSKNKSSSTKKDGASIFPVLFYCFGSSFFVGCVLKLITDTLTVVSPQMLKLLIQFVSGNEEQWKGYFYIAIIFLVGLVSTILQAQYFHMMMLVGMRIKTVLVSAIFRKTLLLSNSARNNSTVGEIVNLMAVDAQKIQDMTLHLCMLWSAPFQIALSLYFLWQTLGPSVLSGLALIILLIPFNSFIATRMKKLQARQMKKKDQRVKLMNEILSGIKVLKLNAWETSFEEQVVKIREAELKVLKYAAYLFSGIAFIWQCSPFLVAFVTFATFVLVDESNVLDAEKAFVSLALFNILKRSLTIFPLDLTNAIQASVSLNRLNKFLNAGEMDKEAVNHDQNEEDQIVIENGYFCWNKQVDASPVLKGISIRVPKASLCAIVGEVGSGKSSLLSAILGELDKESGRVNAKGAIAYVGQQAWIQNATLKDNVIFGSMFNWSRYEKVIEACALNPDLEVLPAGHDTEIGEKGINLSGGQKQRVSLARAVYNNADVYLLDDPLSAVDSHVGKHIFENVIGPKGILKGKTRVLVTHGITHLPQVDFVVVMSGGEISEIGTYRELVNKKGAFSEFLLRHLESKEMENGDLAIIQDIEKIVGTERAKNILTRQLSRSSDRGSSSTGDLSLRRSISREGNVPLSISKEMTHRKSKDGEKQGERLIQKEQAQTGATDWKTYLYYAKSMGWHSTIVVLLFYVMCESFSSGSNVWLSEWSNVKSVNGSQDIPIRNKYLSIYGGLGVGQVLSYLSACLLLAYSSIQAASILHYDVLRRILRAPSWFFDVTPTGRIVNRFAKDVDGCDKALPDNIRDFLNCFFKVISTLVIICYSSPLFITVIIPTGFIYILVQRFYVASSRQLKRLESVSRSPIYSHFSETISGCTTIRAFDVQERFIMESERSVDYNQRAYFAWVAANRWLSIRLEGIGNILVLFASLFAVLGRGSLTPGLVGLSVSYALQITQTLNWMVRMSTSVENNMVSVERLKEYTEVPQEKMEGLKPPESWPETGKIQFQNYQTRYREGLDIVLQDITANIEASEKIGIVGRTGSGKSSLALGLFRLLEPTAGCIKIDDKETLTLALTDLRSRLTIIPQDPVLFSGTLRINLDPFSKFDDDTLWRALEQAHLKSFVQTLSNGLYYDVSEGGQNLSVGQRQLLCLARALLRKSKILLLDEATAQVDLDLDELIQGTIRTEFKDSTILTIAHRLNTIMDSDRVMVLDKGFLREFDRPDVLLRNKNSIFYQMAKDAGLTQ